MGFDNAYVLNAIRTQFPGELTGHEETYGMLSVEIESQKIVDVLAWLKNHPELKVAFLTDICGIHYPDHKGKEIGVIYHVHSLTNNICIRIKCFIPSGHPEIASATSVYVGANWMERETYDFFGVKFTGHPDLRRILNVEEMNYFPMLKEYPLEDQERTDKEDKYFGR